MADFIFKVTQEAERNFNNERNLFPARNAMASIALFGRHLLEPEGADELRQHSNEVIVRMLASKGAAGEVYAHREDLGSGEEDGSDTVIVHARNGRATGQMYHVTNGKIVIRASTEEANNDLQ